MLYSRNVGKITFRCLYVFHVSGRGAVRFPAVKRRFPPGKTYVSRQGNIKNADLPVQNVLAVGGFRSAICLATWKSPGFGCETVAPFPVFPEIFFGFPAFLERNSGRDFPAGRRKMVAGFIFFRSLLGVKWPFPGNFCLPAGTKMAYPENFHPSDDIKMTVPGEQIRKIWDFFGGQERTFLGFSFRSLKKMSLIADKFYRVSVVFLSRTVYQPVFFSVYPLFFCIAPVRIFAFPSHYVRTYAPARNI